MCCLRVNLLALLVWLCSKWADVSHVGAGDGTVELEDALYASGGMGSVPQRDADLLHLYTAYQRAPAGSAKVRALEALNLETSARAFIDKAVRVATTVLLGSPAVLSKIEVREKSSDSDLYASNCACVRMCVRAHVCLSIAFIF